MVITNDDIKFAKLAHDACEMVAGPIYHTWQDHLPVDKPVVKNPSPKMRVFLPATAESERAAKARHEECEMHAGPIYCTWESHLPYEWRNA